MGQWHDSCLFGSIHHQNGFENKWDGWNIFDWVKHLGSSVLIIHLNPSFWTVQSGTMSLAKWTLIAFIMSVRHLFLSSVPLANVSLSDIWLVFFFVVPLPTLPADVEDADRHSWYSKPCLRLMWWIKLLMLLPAPTNLAQQHLQKMLIWSMSGFLKPKNFQTANMAPLLGPSSSAPFSACSPTSVTLPWDIFFTTQNCSIGVVPVPMIPRVLLSATVKTVIHIIKNKKKNPTDIWYEPTYRPALLCKLPLFLQTYWCLYWPNGTSFFFHRTKEYFSKLYYTNCRRFLCWTNGRPALQSLQQVLCTSFTICIFHTENQRHFIWKFSFQWRSKLMMVQ